LFFSSSLLSLQQINQWGKTGGKFHDASGSENRPHPTTMSAPIESVQTFGRKKTATAVAFVKKGSGLIKVNGVPISLLQPDILKLKTFEPVLLIGTEKFSQVSQVGCAELVRDEGHAAGR